MLFRKVRSSFLQMCVVKTEHKRLWSDPPFTPIPTTGRVYDWSVWFGLPSAISQAWRWIHGALGSHFVWICLLTTITLQDTNAITFQEIATGNSYAKCLANYLNPTAQALFPAGEFTFQEDNCRINTRRAVKLSFEEHDDAVPHLAWLAKFPDLNIIEPLRSIL